MDYKLLSKDNGTGFKYWVENLMVLMKDYGLNLPQQEQLIFEYHKGVSVWDLFLQLKGVEEKA